MRLAKSIPSIMVKIVVLGILALLSSACNALALPGTSAVATQPPREITMAMGFIPNIQFAPFYVAIEKGYFTQENLQVKFDYGMENDLLVLAGSGKVSFVVGSADQVLLARSQGLPVVYVMNWYSRWPISLFSLQPMKTPQDLVGKKVGIPGMFGASYVGWKAMLYANHIAEDKITVESIGFTQVAAITQGKVDVAIGYAMNEPVQLRSEGKQVWQLDVADYINLVANGLITNEDTLKKEPQLVQAVVRASWKGLKYTLDHPDEAFDISLKYVPEAAQQKESQRAVLNATLPFWKANDLGYSDNNAWQISEKFMREAGLLPQDVEVAKAYTNQFVEVAAHAGH
ncbi:MAG: myristoyl transferase [Chloroflexi bacterium]|nr:myristoyl transferase [Chloroflexota bacterium]